MEVQKWEKEKAKDAVKLIFNLFFKVGMKIKNGKI